MTTGARRGEVCALRWDRFDANAAVLVITSSVAQRGKRTWEKDTKTHQQRRIALDAQTVALLTAYRRHCAERAGVDDMPGTARIFSPLLGGMAWIKPDTVSQRYERMCARIGWEMHIHQLRHYSATELIAAGVDVRTVAGRLGHGGRRHDDSQGVQRVRRGSRPARRRRARWPPAIPSCSSRTGRRRG